MIEFILILSMFSKTGAGGLAVSVTALPIPFYSQEECTAAGETAMSGLIKGTNLDKTINFVCVKRSPPK